MIKEITSAQASEIIDNYAPLGKFWLKEGEIYVGIDNSTGDAWTEDFKDLKKCMEWLEGMNLHDEIFFRNNKIKELTDEIYQLCKKSVVENRKITKEELFDIALKSDLINTLVDGEEEEEE